jgi:hypothetical protein
MSHRFNELRFWQRWLLTGALAGVLAGIILILSLIIVSLIKRESSEIIHSNSAGAWILTALSGGVYGLGQGLAQRLFLAGKTPKLQRSLQINFITTILGTVVTGILAVLLLLNGFQTILTALKANVPLIFAAAVFIVGGFGGIAQGILQRFMFRTATEAGYVRWVLPLALCGHVNGAVMGFIAFPIVRSILSIAS